MRMLAAVFLAFSVSALSTVATAETWYAVDVKTADTHDGGTDGGVYLKFAGSKGSSGFLNLENSKEDDMEQLDRDTYFFKLPSDIGKDVDELSLDLFTGGNDPDWTYNYLRIYKRVGTEWKLIYNATRSSVEAKAGDRPSCKAPEAALHNGTEWSNPPEFNVDDE